MCTFAVANKIKPFVTMNIKDNIVYLLYEGDAWLSTDSLVLMGIFSSRKKLEAGARVLAFEHINQLYDKDDCAYEGMTRDEGKNACIDNVVKELMTDNQTQGYEVNFDIRVAELNKMEEI